MMTTNTLGGFCRDLLGDDLSGHALDPEAMAARFVDYFHLPVRPTLDELTGLMERAGFGTVRDGHMEGLKGAHIGEPSGEYHIYHRSDLWEGTKAHTVLHEAYEIIHETMCDLHSGGPPCRTVCREADRFAAAVLMQPDVFLPYARASGLDVATLHDQFGCAYSSVALRMAELVRDPPLLVVLYEREERGDPEGWTDPPTLRAGVVKRTAGFGARRSPLLNGRRGGMPHKGKALPAGSLAEGAAKSGRAEYAEEDGVAAIATPVHWKGRLAKVIVVAVAWENRSVLKPQLGHQRHTYPRSYARAVTAAP